MALGIARTAGGLRRMSKTAKNLGRWRPSFTHSRPPRAKMAILTPRRKSMPYGKSAKDRLPQLLAVLRSSLGSRPPKLGEVARANPSHPTRSLRQRAPLFNPEATSTAVRTAVGSAASLFRRRPFHPRRRRHDAPSAAEPPTRDDRGNRHRRKVMRIATGEETEEVDSVKSAAAELGARGGRARAAALTKVKRSEIAR
jgi:hypothetical protein